jgi:hypothetical protein
MELAVPGAVVEHFEHWIPRLTLPDPDDRHVLAAAIASAADVIVTFNTRDFPPAAVAEHGIEVRDPDAFVLDLLALRPEMVHAAARAQRASLRKPPRSVDEYLADLRNGGLPRFAETLRATRMDL